jgi:carbonic anhydrase/acetyltransferase-like protein (isoleucine patch superfamily)
MTLWALGDIEPTIHATAFVHPAATLIGAVTVGEQASVWPGAVLRADVGVIEVGARSSIQDGTVLHTTERWPTVVGADCVVGHAVHLEGCRVEDGCLVGSGAVVLNRALVGAGSVVGAQALVPEDFVVPPGQMAVGVPVRLRPAPADAKRWIAEGVAFYVANARRYATEMRRLDP